ncbi:hypothetical protein HWV62_29110 [Athelia sp. TMB]|nr:hypothetical protein HWV62_29110 [Athelia sp. TMB]
MAASSTTEQSGGGASGSSTASTPPPTHTTASATAQPTTSTASPTPTPSTSSEPAHTPTTESTQTARTTAASSPATSSPPTQSTPPPSTVISTPASTPSPITATGSSGGVASTSIGGESSPISAPGTQIASGSSLTPGKWTGPYSSIASTWVTVFPATPTTETFATQTTIGNSVVQTTEVLTTHYGGGTQTMTGFVPVNTNNSQSVNNNSSPAAKAAHAAKIGGAVIGGIVVGGILLCLAFFGCRILHRRRVLLNRERLMSDNWLSRPFSRAPPRHSYQDMEGGSGEKLTTEVPMTPMSSASSAAPATHPGEPPISPIAFATASSWADRGPVSVTDRAVQKGRGKLSLAAISGPIGPVRVEGEGEAIRSMVSLQEAQTQRIPPDQDPFLDSPEAASYYPATNPRVGVEHAFLSPRAKATAAGGFEHPGSHSDDGASFELDTSPYVL